MQAWGLNHLQELILGEVVVAGAVAVAVIAAAVGHEGVLAGNHPG